MPNSFAQDAATVRTLLARHIQTPDAREQASEEGDRIAREIRAAGVELPARLTDDSLAPLLDRLGVTADRWVRRRIRDALVLRAMGDAHRAGARGIVFTDRA